MDEEKFLEFASKIGVMKPAHIDDDKPAHLQRMQEILKSDAYAAEEKVDGCHYLMLGCRFLSTEGVEKTGNYPHLRDFFMHLQMPNIILDGECNYPGRTSQFCTRVTGASPDTAIAFQNTNGFIHYTMWDIIRTPKGTWLSNTTYAKRREILEEFYKRYIVGTGLEPYIHLTERRLKNKQEYYKDVIASGKEGIVLKRLDSLYVMGKKPMWQWMKLKQKDEADFFISGFEDPKAEYTGTQIEDWPWWSDLNGVLRPVTKPHYMGWIGSLRLSAYVNGEPQVICTCSGLTEELLEAIKMHPSSFINRVIKITFMEKTEAGIPRHPRFEMFHESKTARECIWKFD